MSTKESGALYKDLQEIINDLITRPGLGMFAWMCLVFFVIALIFFAWALRSGQMSDLEESKFDMLEDNPKKELNGGRKNNVSGN